MNAPIPNAGESSVPSVKVIFCLALWVLKQYCGLPLARPALTAHSAPVQDDEVARRDIGDTLAHRLDHTSGLMAQQERKLVADATLAVVHVRVADPARLDLDNGFTRTRIRHDDVDDLHRRTLGASDYSLDGAGHAALL